MVSEASDFHVLAKSEFLALVGVLITNFIEVSEYRFLDTLDHLCRFAMRTADRFGDHLVDDSKTRKISTGQLENLGCPGRVARIFPQDRCTTLGRDDGVV